MILEWKCEKDNFKWHRTTRVKCSIGWTMTLTVDAREFKSRTERGALWKKEKTIKKYKVVNIKGNTIEKWKQNAYHIKLSNTMPLRGNDKNLQRTSLHEMNAEALPYQS